jgi:hypothetical protein
MQADPSLNGTGMPRKMDLLSTLAAGPSVFRGEGVNHENERFAGELRLQLLEAGRAILLHYTATLANGDVAHTEATLLAVGPDGKLTLWPVMSELPVVIPHVALEAAQAPGVVLRTVFSTGPRTDASVFREEISIEVHEGGALVYQHAWGLPGGSFAERSSCRMEPIHVGRVDDPSRY